MSCFILSLGLFALLFAAPGGAAPARQVGPLPEGPVLAVLAVVWLAGLLAVTWSQWERPRPSLPLVTLPSLLGFVVTAAATVARTPPAAAPLGAAAVTLLGGLTLGMALYTMVLGHWYLSVARLPIAILARAVAVYSVLLALRLVWDAVAFATQSLPYQGLPLPLYAFVGTLDGLLVAVAVFFGTLFSAGRQLAGAAHAGRQVHPGRHRHPLRGGGGRHHRRLLLPLLPAPLRAVL